MYEVQVTWGRANRVSPVIFMQELRNIEQICNSHNFHHPASTQCRSVVLLVVVVVLVEEVVVEEISPAAEVRNESLLGARSFVRKMLIMVVNITQVEEVSNNHSDHQLLF